MESSREMRERKQALREELLTIEVTSGTSEKTPSRDIKKIPNSFSSSSHLRIVCVLQCMQCMECIAGKHYYSLLEQIDNEGSNKERKDPS